MVNRLGIVHCALLLHVPSISVEQQQQQQQQHGDISLCPTYMTICITFHIEALFVIVGFREAKVLLTLLYKLKHF